jgi:hypothetical protein
MTNKPIIPITRISKWFSETDFLFEQELGREAIEGDGNYTVVLYKVNRNTTQSDDVYNEASSDGIRYDSPIELKVQPTFAPPENKGYQPNGGARFVNEGPLTFGIYTQQLKELETDIRYGDYIGWPVDETTLKFYVVSDDGIKNWDDKHTIMGYKPAFRTIICAPVDETEFSSI